MEELRSEMLEMRDMYLEEDVYQLQELRQQLEQVTLTDTPVLLELRLLLLLLLLRHLLLLLLLLLPRLPLLQQ